MRGSPRGSLFRQRTRRAGVYRLSRPGAEVLVKKLSATLPP
jgi:hypothetical protein